MKHNIKLEISKLIETKEEFYDHLDDDISRFLTAIEDYKVEPNDRKKKVIRKLANVVKESFESYSIWINGYVNNVLKVAEDVENNEYMNRRAYYGY